jgi:ParB family chromosome partitioning protein
MAKKVALGKGIASLIQEGSHPSLNSKSLDTLKEAMVGDQKSENRNIENDAPHSILISEIKTNPNQPRKIFKDKELEELCESIKENGVIQPVLVVKGERGYELIAGERRLRAAKKAGLEAIPAIVKRATDRERVVMSIIENVQRADLNCVEEALAYYQLMDEYELTQEEVAKKIGKERSSIANFLRILKLPRQVIELLQKEMLSFGHAKLLVGLKEREESIRAANEAATQGLSVRELEKWLKTNRSKRKTRARETDYFSEKLTTYKDKLEQKTGYHFNINSKKNGAGAISIKFSNEAEFNDIYEYLLTK